MKRVVITILLLTIPLFAEAVSEFDKKLSVRGLILFNYIALDFYDFKDGTLQTNNPVEVGIGLGYGDFSFDIQYALPFTKDDRSSASKNFDFATSYFPGNFWIDAWIKYYNRFSYNDEENKNNVEIELEFANYGSSVLYILNGEKHSPRAAYYLDRKQNISSGSVLVGADIQRASMKNDGETDFLAEWEHLDYAGPQLGASYTFLFNNPKYFMNIFGVLGVNFGYNERRESYVFLPETEIKMTFGYAGDNWAWNIVFGSKTTNRYESSENFDAFFEGSFSTLVIRRF